MSIEQKTKQDIIDNAILEKSDGILAKGDPISRQDETFSDEGLPQWNVNFNYQHFFVESTHKFEFKVTEIATGKIIKEEFIVPANGKVLSVRPILSVLDGELPKQM